MVTQGLLEWYAACRRDLPWRRDRQPYRVWVSEVMLQQTRVEAVIPYYERFLAALPTVEALAAAPEEQLLKLWEGLGYYSRVRNLQKAAQEIVRRGDFPRTAAELKKLSGFGDYTSGAVASIAFGERTPAVDGNVLRVWARMEAVPDSIRMPSVRRQCARDVLDAMPEGADPGDYNQALMELGATVCVPRQPRCGACPVRAHCKAYAEGEQEDYPVSGPKPAKVEEEFDVYLIVQEGKALVRRRPARGLLAGLWEFPHGIAGVRVRPGGLAVEVRHVFTHKIWVMHGVYADLTGPAEGEWVDAAALRALPMASAMEKFRAVLLESGDLQDERSH